jgi:hypothetical protein
MPRLPSAQGMAPRLAALMGVLVLVTLAYWVQRLIAPRPVAALPVDVEVPRRAEAGSEIAALFGVKAASVDARLDGLVLTGVFAGRGARGFATFRTARGGASALVGQEVLPGVRLERVEARRVRLSVNGRESFLELPEPRLGEAAPAPDTARD